MKSLRIFPAVALLLGSFVFSPGALAVNDPNAAVVKLRDPFNGGCLEAGVTLDNCFTDVASLNSWIGTRLPSAAKPLLVDIGPGTFTDEPFRCVNKGHITVRGSGRPNTTLGPSSITGRGMFLRNCTNLNVLNLKLVGTYATIDWGGTGITTWTDVEVIGAGFGWYESGDVTCSQQQTKHYWFGSRIEGQTYGGNTHAYGSSCGENWFFGSELISSPNGLWREAFPIWVSGIPSCSSCKGEAHIYGSVLRVNVTSAGNHTTSFPVAAAYAQGGQIHIHGTGIDVISQASITIAALKADSGGMIHANGAAYNLSTGVGGTVTRIANNGGHVHAPYLWEHIPDPAVAPNFTSVNGADMTTEVVNNGADINMLVYNNQCTGAGGPWYNVALRTCR